MQPPDRTACRPASARPLLRQAADQGDEGDDLRAVTDAVVEEMIAFLARDRAIWLTGSQFRVDGGIIPTV